MKVSELAKTAHVTRDTVRHYTRLGLIKARKDAANGYHRYDRKALLRLRFIRLAQGLGFNLQDIELIFAHAHKGKSPCPQVRALIQQRLTENVDTVRELTRLFKRMQRAVTQWESMPDGVPTGDVICSLIESQDLTKQGRREARPPHHTRSNMK